MAELELTRIVAAVCGRGTLAVAWGRGSHNKEHLQISLLDVTRLTPASTGERCARHRGIE